MWDDPARRARLRHARVLGLLAGLLVIAVAGVLLLRPGGVPSKLPTHAQAPVTPRLGGTVEVAGATVTIPPGAVTRSGRVVASIQPGLAGDHHGERAGHAALAPAGKAVSVRLVGAALRKPVTVTVRVNPSRLPRVSDAPGQPNVVWLAYYQHGRRRWKPVPSRYDASAGVVTATVSHLSDWAPWTWDWRAIETRLRQALSAAGSGRAPEKKCPAADGVSVADAGGKDPPVYGCAEADGPYAVDDRGHQQPTVRARPASSE